MGSFCWTGKENNEAVEEIDIFDPDVVGFTTIASTYVNPSLRIVRKIREASYLKMFHEAMSQGRTQKLENDSPLN